MARTYSLPTTRPAGKPCPPAGQRRPRHGLLGLRVAGSPALPNVARSRSVAEASRQACEERQFWADERRRQFRHSVGRADAERRVWARRGRTPEQLTVPLGRVNVDRKVVVMGARKRPNWPANGFNRPT